MTGRSKPSKDLGRGRDGQWAPATEGCRFNQDGPGQGGRMEGRGGGERGQDPWWVKGWVAGMTWEVLGTGDLLEEWW